MGSGGLQLGTTSPGTGTVVTAVRVFAGCSWALVVLSVMNTRRAFAGPGMGSVCKRAGGSVCRAVDQQLMAWNREELKCCLGRLREVALDSVLRFGEQF